MQVGRLVAQLPELIGGLVFQAAGLVSDLIFDLARFVDGLVFQAPGLVAQLAALSAACFPNWLALSAI
jgi:hypothetical protein